MSAPLNTAEKSLLQHWLADGAPGYSKVVLNPNNQQTRAPLAASDYAAISALDNDVIRGYLSSYKVQKLASLAVAVTNAEAGLARGQNLVTSLQGTSTAVGALSVQAVPTAAS